MTIQEAITKLEKQANDFLLTAKILKDFDLQETVNTQHYNVVKSKKEAIIKSTTKYRKSKKTKLAMSKAQKARWAKIRAGKK